VTIEALQQLTEDAVRTDPDRNYETIALALFCLNVLRAPRPRTLDSVKDDSSALTSEVWWQPFQQRATALSAAAYDVTTLLLDVYAGLQRARPTRFELQKVFASSPFQTFLRTVYTSVAADPDSVGTASPSNGSDTKAFWQKAFWRMTAARSALDVTGEASFAHCDACDLPF